MKYGQLVEGNVRNIFLEKSYSKCCGETSLRRFSEKSKLGIFLDQLPEILCSLFLVHAQL